MRRSLTLALVLAATTAAAQTTTTRTDRLIASTQAIVGGTALGANTLNVTGTLGVSSTTTLAGALAANAGITVDGTAFSVADGTGNTSVGGTLGVTGLATLTAGAVARSATATDGYLALSPGTALYQGYVGFHAPGASNLRQGYLGWGASNVNLYFENNALFRVHGAMQADELHVKNFVADLEQALAGGQIIAKSVAVVAEDFACPAAGGTATLYVRDLPSMANTAAFVANDWVVLRTFSRSGGTLSIGDCVGQVSSYADQSGTREGQQAWTFTRGTSTCAGGWTSGTITADSLALDYGASGAGFAEVNAADGSYGANAPYYRIRTWATCPIGANMTTRTQMGQLNGAYGYATSTWGFAAGTATANALTVDATNGIRMLNNGVVLGQWSGSTLTLGQPLTSASTGQIEITSSSINLRWRNSTNTATATVFSVNGDSDAGGQANVTGNLYVTGLVRVPTLSNPSGNLTLSAASAGTDVIVSLNGGELRPYATGTHGLGSASYVWASVYANDVAPASSTPLKLIGGTWYFDGTYTNTFNCNYTADSNQACWINYRGYNGGTTRFRDLYIGDGKGGTMLQVDGVNARVGINKSSPSYTLDVSGTANATSYRVGGTAGVSGTCSAVTVTNGLVTGCTP